MKLVLASQGFTTEEIAKEVEKLVGKPLKEINIAIINEAYVGLDGTKDKRWLIKELSNIEKYIGTNDYVITLEIEGKEIDSVSFAKLIDKTFITHSTITFIIGSSTGLSNRIKNRSNYQLSFSSLTFPHGLFRGILLEQIYRAFKINNHENYHK